MVLDTGSEIKALVEGRARERMRATLPLREDAEMNESTWIPDGRGSLSGACINSLGAVQGFGRPMVLEGAEP